MLIGPQEVRYQTKVNVVARGSQHTARSQNNIHYPRYIDCHYIMSKTK